MDISLQIVNSR